MDLKYVLFGFKGRITRAEYWIGTATVAAAVIAAGSFALLLFQIVIRPTGNMHNPLVGFLLLLMGVTLLAAVLPIVAVHIKRLHDRGKSGGWLLLWVVPATMSVASDTWLETAGPGAVAAFAFAIWMIFELGALPGTTGPNRYGADPLQGVS